MWEHYNLRNKIRVQLKMDQELTASSLILAMAIVGRAKNTRARAKFRGVATTSPDKPVICLSSQ